MKKRKRQIDYFESRDPHVTRKMKPDPAIKRDPVKEFRERFCKPLSPRVR